MLDQGTNFGMLSEEEVNASNKECILMHQWFCPSIPFIFVAGQHMYANAGQIISPVFMSHVVNVPDL